jgi:basic amino acid/polyamine antiporter, APA family
MTELARVPTQDSSGVSEPALQRRISLPLLTLYGLGTTIGAGIYVIIGAAAAKAGGYTPLVFFIASIVAGFSAASFAELSTRIPVSAGEAAYIREGLGLRNVSLLVGLAVATGGVVSSATLLQGGVGYLKQLVGAPDFALFMALLIILGGIVAWGIVKSLAIAALFTLVEIGGLISVILFAPADPATLAARAWASSPPLDGAILLGMSSSVLLAFFAFTGFQSMVNVVEEVTDPARTMPRAIALTLLITTTLYVWIALIAIAAVPPAELGASEAPLALVFGRLAGSHEKLFSLVAMTAVLNGVIIQLVMASRVIYGLSRAGQIPQVFGRVSPLTNTPLVATGTICLVVAALGASLSLTSLAQTTSAFTLGAFAMINLALWRLKRGTPHVPGAFTVPQIVPILGLLTSLAFLIVEVVRRGLALLS